MHIIKQTNTFSVLKWGVDVYNDRGVSGISRIKIREGSEGRTSLTIPSQIDIPSVASLTWE